MKRACLLRDIRISSISTPLLLSLPHSSVHNHKTARHLVVRHAPCNLTSFTLIYISTIKHPDSTMQCTRTTAAHNILARQSTTSILKAFNGTSAATFPTSRAALLVLQHGGPTRQFSTTKQRSFNVSSPMLMKEFFPVRETQEINKTPPAWAHPVYTEEQMNAVVVAHREAKNWSDKVALTAVRILRFGLDLATGYKHNKAVKLNKDDPKAANQQYGMTERKYMIRNIFLESVAGVPGMVGGMLRHLHSMRRMKRDNGWMETLLEESYNERMVSPHLKSFQP